VWPFRIRKKGETLPKDGRSTLTLSGRGPKSKDIALPKGPEEDEERKIS